MGTNGAMTVGNGGVPRYTLQRAHGSDTRCTQLIYMQESHISDVDCTLGNINVVFTRIDACMPLTCAWQMCCVKPFLFRIMFLKVTIHCFHLGLLEWWTTVIAFVLNAEYCNCLDKCVVEFLFWHIRTWLACIENKIIHVFYESFAYRTVALIQIIEN